MELYEREVIRYRDNLYLSVDRKKEELEILFGGKLGFGIAAKSDGYVKKYYWRFKAGGRGRKYLRLADSSILDYLATLEHPNAVKLKEIERHVIYVNSNLRVLKGILDSIEQCRSEIAKIDEVAL